MGKKTWLLLGFAFTFAFILIGNMGIASADTLYEHYNEGDVHQVDFKSNQWIAQTFTIGTVGPNENFNVKKVRAKLKQYSSSGTINVFLREVDSEGKPTGNNLASNETVQLSELPTSPTGDWVYFTLGENPLLEQGTTYALIFTTESLAFGYWRLDNTSPTYGGGAYIVSSNGANWNDPVPTQDLMFEIYGSANHPPILEPIGHQTIIENQTLTIQLEATDPDNDTLTFNTTAGNVLPSPFYFNSTSGLFEWTPGIQDSGVYDVEFSVTDGEQSDEENITITVLDPLINNPPILFRIGNKSIDENQTLTIQLEAADPDPWDNLTFLTNAGDVLPSQFSINSLTGLFEWTPTFDDSGTYNVTFFVTDGELGDKESIFIIANNVNRPPKMQQIEEQTINETNILYLKINATDPDRDNLTFSTNAQEILPGLVEFNNQTGELRYVPGFYASETYEVRFSARDEEFTVSQEVIITVINTPYPIVIDPIGPQEILEGQTLSLDVNATDHYNPNSTITYLTDAYSVLPSQFSFNSETGIFIWNPSFMDSGNYSVIFFATNGEFWTEEETVISVYDDSCPPDINGDENVDVTDLLTVLDNWGSIGPGDLNSNGVVDVGDLLILMDNWGSCQ